MRAEGVQDGSLAVLVERLKVPGPIEEDSGEDLGAEYGFYNGGQVSGSSGVFMMASNVSGCSFKVCSRAPATGVSC